MKLIEGAAEESEELLDKFIEDHHSITPDDIIASLRKATLENRITPVLCGSSLHNKGVQKLIDAVIHFLPSPMDVPAIQGINPFTNKEEERHPDENEPFSALAFKIATDPFVGNLTFFRVYSGVLSTGDPVWNPVKGKRERIGRILQMHANDRAELKEVRAGDIAAAVGLKDVTTGDTLCDMKNVITLERMEFPEPVISVAVEPKTKADQEKMGLALSKLAQEDPSFRVHTDEESGQTIISGMGELHLEIIVDRLRREFRVEANVGNPQVAYRETLSRPVEIDYTHKKQTGGSGQFARIKVQFEPQEAGAGFEFESGIVGGSVPREFIPGVAKGIEASLENGVIAGFNQPARIFGSTIEVGSTATTAAGTLVS